MQLIDVRQLAKLQNSEELELIDVRTPVEFRELHAEGAVNVPLGSLDPAEFVGKYNSDHPLYVICQSGSRSGKAVEKLTAAGVEDVIGVDGGTNAWEQAGLPVTRGKKAISLERQVRIVAGFLVLVGALGTFISPHTIWLSAFIGAGLMFAGITDTCGMGMMLAKMPWNQCGSECAADPSAETHAGAAA